MSGSSNWLRRSMMWFWSIFAQQQPSPQLQVTRMGTFERLQTLPHDPNAFTQGLVAILDEEQDDDNNIILYEGTGLYGQSELRQVDLKTGRRIQWQPLADVYFGEGIVHYQDSSGNGRILQLTWREETALLYDSNTFELLYSFTYSTTNYNQGWGITLRKNDALQREEFIVSDGSAYLHTWDKNTFTQKGRVQVTKRDTGSSVAAAVTQLNELEWDPNTDTILANVWQTDTVVRIDPESGFVTVEYDLESLYPYSSRPPYTNVLNGIARVPKTEDEFFITGKRWPVMFRVRLST